MFEKMIAQQTAKKVKLLDDFLKKHEAEYPFPEDVELIRDIDYMGAIFVGFAYLYFAIDQKVLSNFRPKSH